MSLSILQINASLVPEHSKSIQLSNNYINLLQKKIDLTLITRDLSNVLKSIDSTWIEAAYTPSEKRTNLHEKTLSLSNLLIDEIKNADEIVISTPMYNFTVPANLKTYFDLIARVGETFKYTETGPIGLIKDKPITVIITTGGSEIGSDNDYMSPYIIQMLNFIGIKNITIIAADKQSFNADKSFSDANNKLVTMAS